MYAHPGKKLLFMGAEFGQWQEWNHDASLDWHLLAEPMHGGLQRFVRDLNRIYVAQAPLHEVDFEAPGFEWIDCSDIEGSVIAFMRRARHPEDWLAVVMNWTPVVREHYRIGVPEPGFYEEVLNSDSELYGGSNVGNEGGREADPVPAHGRPWSLDLRLPPLGGLILKLRPPSP
jgi:1,4-alpha-glucan branching enzyme